MFSLKLQTRNIKNYTLQKQRGAKKNASLFFNINNKDYYSVA